MAVSIGNLEKAVKRFAAKIEALGFAVEIDSFRSGPGGDAYYGPSYVELAVERDADDPENFYYETIKFLANGFGATSTGDVGGETWGEMKAEAIDRLGIEGLAPRKRPALNKTERRLLERAVERGGRASVEAGIGRAPQGYKLRSFGMRDMQGANKLIDRGLANEIKRDHTNNCAGNMTTIATFEITDAGRAALEQHNRRGGIEPREVYEPPARRPEN